MLNQIVARESFIRNYLWNYQKLRQLLHEEYGKVLKETSNDELAYSEVSDILDSYSNRIDKRFINGLKNELLFYHLYRKELNLKPSTSLNDKYFKFDYVGIHPKTRRKMFIDVTSNIRVKSRKISEYKKLYVSLDQLGVNGDYFIAFMYKDKFEISPVLIPIHRDGVLGYTVAGTVYEKKEGSIVQPYSDLVILFIDKEREENYIDFKIIDSLYLDTVIFQPILMEFIDLYIPVWGVSKGFINELFDNGYALARSIRKISRVYPLVVLELRYTILDKDGDGVWAFITTWKNPILDRELDLTSIFGDIFEEPIIPVSSHIP